MAVGVLCLRILLTDFPPYVEGMVGFGCREEVSGLLKDGGNGFKR